jgi:hypothetical protein
LGFEALLSHWIQVYNEFNSGDEMEQLMENKIPRLTETVSGAG